MKILALCSRRKSTYSYFIPIEANKITHQGARVAHPWFGNRTSQKYSSVRWCGQTDAECLDQTHKIRRETPSATATYSMWTMLDTVVRALFIISCACYLSSISTFQKINSEFLLHFLKNLLEWTDCIKPFPVSPWLIKRRSVCKGNKFICDVFYPISGRVDRASATEAVDSGSIPGRVKPKTIKIGIHSFPAWRSAFKGTVWSLHRVW